MSTARLRAVATLALLLALLTTLSPQPVTGETSGGTVWAWGDNASGQLGDGTITDRPVPGPVVNLTTVIAIAADENHGLALTVDGTDTTPPACTSSANPSQLWPPNLQLVKVTVTLNCTDAASGVAAITLVSTTSNEGDEAHDIHGFTIGTDDRDGKLRAERNGSGEGRVYTLIYAITDNAGNRTTEVVTVRVPHDQGSGNET